MTFITPKDFPYDLVDMIEISVLLGNEEADQTRLAFNWSEVSAGVSVLEVSLNFEKPYEVSQGVNPDTLLVQVRQSNKTDEFDELKTPHESYQISLPLQISP